MSRFSGSAHKHAADSAMPPRNTNDISTRRHCILLITEDPTDTFGVIEAKPTRSHVFAKVAFRYRGNS